MNAPEAIPHSSITSTIAAFCPQAERFAINPIVNAAAKRSFVDAIGVSIAGSREPGPTILADYVSSLRAKSSSTIVAQGIQTAPSLAAWVNGTAADVLGWADFSLVQMNHPSAAVVPTVLALGEATGASGAAVFRAYVVGVEVSNKLARAIKPDFHTKGWHALGVCNTFGACAAAARLLEFDERDTANAFGIAGAEASGIKASMVTMTKSYVSGAAARNGIESALLTQRGFTGPQNVFEGRDGFLQTFGSGRQAAELFDDLGSPFEFETPGMTLKLFPSCTHTHTGIAAALEAKRKHRIDVRDIDSVHCRVTPAVFDFLAWPSPRNSREAKFSMQFCVATAFLQPTVTLDKFTEAAVTDPVTIALMKRITMTVDSDYASQGYNPPSAPSGCKMTIALKNGTVLEERMDQGPWEPPNVPSTDSLRQKFIGASAPVVGPERAGLAFNLAMDIDALTDVRKLMEAIR